MNIADLQVNVPYATTAAANKIKAWARKNTATVRLNRYARDAYDGENLDVEHQLGKGSHPELKEDLNNLRLYCRIPCHSNKTDGKVCEHLI